MKKVFALAAAFAIAAASVSAATQISGTPTGKTTRIADYPVEILGTDGNLYACSIDIVAKNGTELRRCVGSDKGGALFGAAAGLSAGTIVAIGVVSLVAIGVASSRKGSSTNGTN